MSDEFLPESDGEPEAGGEDEQADVKAPFSFKLMIALVVIYLGWRLFQGILWAIHQLS
jgi:hypothetical protein